MNHVWILGFYLVWLFLVRRNEVLVADVRLFDVIAEVMEINIVKRVGVKRRVRGSVFDLIIIIAGKKVLILLIRINICLVGVIHIIHFYFHHLVYIWIRVTIHSHRDISSCISNTTKRRFPKILFHIQQSILIIINPL